MAKPIPDDILDILQQATIDGNVIKLNGQLDRPTYDKVNKYLVGIGAKWDRKLGGHVCTMGDAAALLERLQSGDGFNLIQGLQFYPTPDAVAKTLVDLACPWTGKRNILAMEPSAGRGAIVKHLAEKCRWVDAVELNPPFRADIEDAGARYVSTEDFLEIQPSQRFEVIAMNPPFADSRDALHVMQAVKWLAKGGVLVAIVPTMFTEKTTGEYKAIQTFIENAKHDWYGFTFEVVMKLSSDTFKAAGVQPNTMIIKVVRTA